jgi:hypothetical protein
VNQNSPVLYLETSYIERRVGRYGDCWGIVKFVGTGGRLKVCSCWREHGILYVCGGFRCDRTL